MLVGVCGYMGSGKTRLAQRLRDRHGFTIVSPIDPAKKFVGELFGFTDEQLYGASSARDEAHSYMRRADGEPLTARYALDELLRLLERPRFRPLRCVYKRGRQVERRRHGVGQGGRFRAGEVRGT